MRAAQVAAREMAPELLRHLGRCFPFGLSLKTIQARNGDYCNIAPPRAWRVRVS